MQEIAPKIQGLGLVKDFGRGRGVFDVDIKVFEKEIVGFVGPNGAGKTTTMLMLTGFISPDEGEIVIDDYFVTMQNAHRLMPNLGLMLAEISLPPKFSVKQIFKYTSGLYGQNLSENWGNMAEFLELDLNAKFGQLSLGNKKKVGVINALMHQPDVVIMDEPTSGLDPLIQLRFLELLKKVRDRGGAVLLSSHVLSEVQSVCDRIIMIKHGEVIIDSPTADIMEEALKRFRFAHLENKVLKELKAVKEVAKVDVVDDEVVLYTSDRQNVLKVLHKHDVHEFYLEKPSLEEMFIDYYKN